MQVHYVIKCIVAVHAGGHVFEHMNKHAILAKLPMSRLRRRMDARADMWLTLPAAAQPDKSPPSLLQYLIARSRYASSGIATADVIPADLKICHAAKPIVKART